MGQWRILVPIGLAIALWALGIFRLDVPRDISLPVAASSPCRPTAAEVAATDVALAPLPTTTPTPAIAGPIVTTELVVLAGDRDVPQLIPSLIIRAPARDQPAISKLLSTSLTELGSEISPTALPTDGAPPTAVPLRARVQNNAYRTLLTQLLTNEDETETRDDIGVLATGHSARNVLQDVLGISEPPLIGVSGNGTVTLVIPQTTRALADNKEAFAGGWTVNSSGRAVTLLFDGRPEAKTAWDVHVCTDGLPIISTNLITPTPGPRARTPSPTPPPTPAASVATTTPTAESTAPAVSPLVFQNPTDVYWSFPEGMEPTAVKITTQAPVLSAARMFLSTDLRRNLVTALALFVPAGMLLLGTWLVLRYGTGNDGTERAKARLAATSMAVIRVAIAAALYPFSDRIAEYVITQEWSSLSYLALVVLASIGLGLLDLPRPRAEDSRQWAEEIALALITLFVVVAAFGYTATVDPPREQFRLIHPGLLIVAYSMFLFTAVRLWLQPSPHLRPRRAMALPAIGVVTLLLCILRVELEQRLPEKLFLVGSLLPLWVTLCVVVGIALLTVALLREIPLRPVVNRPQSDDETAVREIDRRKTIAIWLGIHASVALVIVAILGQWGWAIYSEETIWWRAAVEADPFTNLGGATYADFAPKFLNYPLAFFVSVVELLVVLGLLGFVGVLYATGNPSPRAGQATPSDLWQTASWKSHQSWVKWMLLVLFATFVIGYGGQVIGLRLPVAFLFGLVLLHLTLSNRAEKVSDRIDKLNGPARDGKPVIVHHRGELLHRALSQANIERQLAKALTKLKNGEIPAAAYKSEWDKLSGEAESLLLGTDPAGASTSPLKLAKDLKPGELALTLGPEDSWWENGRLAVNLGSRLAVVPIAYFVYVYIFLSGQGSGWSLSTPFALAGLVTALSYEVAFWLVAAFVLGCLFPFLPGRNGPVKGAVLAAVYIAANAAAALLGIPGNALWQVRSFQLLLFLMLLGAWMDLKTVEAKGFRQRELIALYDLPNTATLVSQVLPVVTALAAVVGQLLLGQTQAATESLISGDAARELRTLLGLIE